MSFPPENYVPGEDVEGYAEWLDRQPVVHHQRCIDHSTCDGMIAARDSVISSQATKIYELSREANALRAENAELRRDARHIQELLGLASIGEDGRLAQFIKEVWEIREKYRDAAFAKGAGT